MGWLKRRRCPHLRQRGIYGDEINFHRGNRAQCLDCGKILPDLPESQERTGGSMSTSGEGRCD